MQTPPKLWFYNIDSANITADSSHNQLEPVTNSTNDVTLHIDSRITQLPIKGIELMSLELIPQQYLIEPAWSNFYFMNGMYVDSLVREFSISATISGSPQTITVRLPYRLNPIVEFGSEQLFSVYPHELNEIKNLWNFGRKIRIVNSANQQDLSTTEGGFPASISFPTTQIINNTSWSFSTPYAATGYIYVPPIPTYAHAANILTTLMNNAIQNVISDYTNAILVAYDTKTGTFSIELVSSHNNFVNPRVVVNTNSILTKLGFNTTSGHTLDPNYTAPNRPTWGREHIRIPSGDYATTPTLTNAINYELTRFNIPASGTYRFTIHLLYPMSSHDVSLPTGRRGQYTGETLTTWINQYIEDSGILPAYGIEMSYTNNHFVITSTSNQQFTVDFTESLLAPILGFRAMIYSGGTSYQSDASHMFANHSHQMTCSHTTEADVVTFDVNNPLPINRHISVALSGVTLTFTYANVYPGYEVGDLVRVNFDSTSVATVLVTGVTTGTVNSFEAKDFDTGLTSTSTITGTRLERIPTVTFLTSHCSKLSRLLGLRVDDITWTPLTVSRYVGPHRVNIQPEKYMIVQLVYPSYTFSMMDHKYEDKDNTYDILAKVILTRPTDHVHRKLYYSALKFTKIMDLRRMRLRFLNPDGSLYQLHGSSWSATLRFILDTTNSQIF